MSKIYLAKIKDGKGRLLNNSAKNCYHNNPAKNASPLDFGGPYPLNWRMPTKSRSRIPSRHQRILSRKDRLGVLLLLLGALLYGLLSRPAVFTSTQWNYAEIPYERKIPPTKLHNNNWAQSKEWKEGLNRQNSFEYESRKYPPAPGSFDRDSNYRSNFKKEKYESRSMAKAPLIISMNQADSMAWEKLPGIGPVLAARIVKYRKKLGGFHSPSQLKEVFGITDSVYEKIATTIRSDAIDLQKIDINKASVEELKKHPYIRWETAKAIVLYREAHGSFHSLEQLKGIWNIPPETIAKIEPYLLADADSLTPTEVGRK